MIAARVVAAGLISLVIGGVASRGANEPAPHYLTFQVGLVGEASAINERAHQVTNLTFADRLSGKVEIRSAERGDGIAWSPRQDAVAVEGRISQSSVRETTLTGEGEVTARETRTETFSGNPKFAANFVNASVTIRPEAKQYDIQFTLMADVSGTQEAVRQTISLKKSGAPSLGGNQPIQNTSNRVPLNMGAGQLGVPVNYDYLVVDVKNQKLDEDYTLLSGSTRIPVPKPSGWTGSWSIAVNVNWQIDATQPPVEFLITVDGYANWRPKGSIPDPTKPGNQLKARATLVPKDGGKVIPAVKSIRFELLDSSREPGVCLNWPLNAKDHDYDLRLSAVNGGTLSRADQTLEITALKRNDDAQPYGETAIDSYDFGGRASLRAICLLKDGREIEGVLREAGGEQTYVRLPKMQSPGWIAEAWRKEKKVEKLAEDADDENVDGQKDNGDGYTLYEEYRGWAVNGKHVEGDPLRKDFFVLNLFKARSEAQPGINLFATLSKLRVHSALRRTEMSEKTRLMNGNRREAPQNVEQHGVWVKRFESKAELGDEGALTKMTKAGVAGRPGITLGVGILARNNAESTFNQPFNLPAANLLFAYDRAIAHELMHSVGVDHHGPRDTLAYALTFIPPNVPKNKIGRPHYQTGDGTPFTLLLENGHDLAASTYVHYAEIVARFGPMTMDMLIKLWSSGLDGAKDPKIARERAEEAFRSTFDHVYEQRGTVGQEHGAHAGEEDCIMRYYFARFYEAKRSTNTLYLVTPGSEAIGLQICHSGKGTGVNAPNPPNLPQSRYGDAAADAGDCFAQICPNDAIPPRTVKP